MKNLRRKKKIPEEDEEPEEENNPKVNKISKIIDTKIKKSLDKEEISVFLKKNNSFIKSFDSFKTVKSFGPNKNNHITVSQINLNDSGFNCSYLNSFLQIEKVENIKRRVSSFHCKTTNPRLPNSMKGKKTFSNEFGNFFVNSKTEESKISKSLNKRDSNLKDKFKAKPIKPILYKKKLELENKIFSPSLDFKNTTLSSNLTKIQKKTNVDSFKEKKNLRDKVKPINNFKLSSESERKSLIKDRKNEKSLPKNEDINSKKFPQSKAFLTITHQRNQSDNLLDNKKLKSQEIFKNFNKIKKITVETKREPTPHKIKNNKLVQNNEKLNKVFTQATPRNNLDSLSDNKNIFNKIIMSKKNSTLKPSIDLNPGSKTCKNSNLVNINFNFNLNFNVIGENTASNKDLKECDKDKKITGKKCNENLFTISEKYENRRKIQVKSIDFDAMKLKNYSSNANENNGSRTKGSQTKSRNQLNGKKETTQKNSMFKTFNSSVSINTKKNRELMKLHISSKNESSLTKNYVSQITSFKKNGFSKKKISTNNTQKTINNPLTPKLKSTNNINLRKGVFSDKNGTTDKQPIVKKASMRKILNSLEKYESIKQDTIDHQRLDSELRESQSKNQQTLKIIQSNKKAVINKKKIT